MNRVIGKIEVDNERGEGVSLLESYIEVSPYRDDGWIV